MLQKAERSAQADQRTASEAPQRLCTSSDWAHKKSISFCVKDAATRRDLDCWVQTRPQPRRIVTEATKFRFAVDVEWQSAPG